MMSLSRHFEQKVNELFMKGMVHGTTHLGIGQEANHAALGAALDERDWVLPTHRSHGHFLGKRGDPYKLMAELFGIEDGACMGLGGSMHLVDLKNHNMGSSAVVAGAVPLAVGMAMALKKDGDDSIVCAMLGDGATNQGMFLESLNLASIWEAPVLFFCENNQYAMSSAYETFVAGQDIPKRAMAFGINAAKVDGNKIEDVYDAVSNAARYIRTQKAPMLIESITYRQLGHSKSDTRVYRTREEEAQWLRRCPILQNRQLLESRFGISSSIMDDIENEAKLQVQMVEERCFANKDKVLELDKALGFVYASGEMEG